MKRLYMLAGLVVVLAVPTVRAQMQITLYQDTANYSYSDGGEFSAVPNAALLSFANPTLAGYVPATADPTAVNPYFQTFCVELSEHFTPGDTYNASFSYNIKYNGGSFLPNGEPLTMGTAWLYSQFAAGTLIGSGPLPYDYTYGGGRTATAGDLQEAIWYLQGEDSLVNGGADGTAFYNAAVSALGATIINDPANGAYGVVVLNLTSGDGNDQDQLMVVPNPSVVVVPVPEPAPVALLGASIALLGALRWRLLRAKKPQTASAISLRK
jgi:hypothetical protein